MKVCPNFWLVVLVTPTPHNNYLTYYIVSNVGLRLFLPIYLFPRETTHKSPIYLPLWMLTILSSLCNRVCISRLCLDHVMPCNWPVVKRKEVSLQSDVGYLCPHTPTLEHVPSDSLNCGQRHMVLFRFTYLFRCLKGANKCVCVNSSACMPVYVCG